MKKFTLPILLVALTYLIPGFSQAKCSITATDVTAGEGSVVDLPINLDSGNDEVLSFQFDLYLPDGVTVQLAANKAPIAKLSARAVDHIVSAAVQSDGSYRYLSFTMTNTPYTGTDGVILTTPVELNAAPGTYTIQIKNASVTINDANLSRVDCANTTATLTIEAPVPTEINLIDGTPYTNDKDIPKVDVTYTRNFPVAKWQALYIPFDMEYDDWADYGIVAQYDSIREYDLDGDGTTDKTTLVFKYITTGSLKANTPCLFKPYNAGEVRFSSQNTTLYAAPTKESAVAHSTTSDIFTLYGNYTVKAGLASLGAFAMSLDGTFVQAATEDQLLNPYRVYLLVSKQDGTPNRSPRLFSMLMTDDTTSELIDLELNVNNDDNWYDISGRKVISPNPGVYIQYGKKVLIK